MDRLLRGARPCERKSSRLFNDTNQQQHCRAAALQKETSATRGDCGLGGERNLRETSHHSQLTWAVQQHLLYLSTSSISGGAVATCPSIAVSHCDVPRGVDKQFFYWTRNTRQKYTQGRLERKKIDQLEALGFCWQPGERDSQRRLDPIAAFKKKYGHLDFDKGNDPEDQAARKHAVFIRYRKKRGELAKRTITALDALSFPWRLEDNKWDEMFTRLVRFRDEHGHTNVPELWSHDRQLGNWVKSQRTLARGGELQQEREQRLTQLGMDLITPLAEQQWEALFERLAKYRDRYGHCQVPREWPEDIELAYWVKRQKTFKRQGRVTAEKQARLEELGLVWSKRPPPRRRRAATETLAAQL